MKRTNLGSGYDIRRNFSIDRSGIGQYATDLLTEEAIENIKGHDKTKPMFMLLMHTAPHAGSYNPLQAPQSEIDKFSYISDKKRRTYAAMVSKLDAGIGKVIKTLKREKMLNNSIILFFSDNGAPVEGGMHVIHF